MNSILLFVHILSLVLWVGGIVTLILSTATMFTTLNVEEAGKVVASLFPKFFWMGLICTLIALVTSYLLGFTGNLDKVRFFILLFMLALVSFSKFYVVPKAHSLKQEYKAEKDNSKAVKLKEQFDTMHKLSTRVLGIILICGLVTIFILSRQLQL